MARSPWNPPKRQKRTRFRCHTCGGRGKIPGKYKPWIKCPNTRCRDGWTTNYPGDVRGS